MQCSCGKQLDKVPGWMSSVQITFICQNCPNRNLQSIADVKIETPEGVEPVKKKKSATK